MRNHEFEKLGVQVGVGDVVNLVDLGGVLHMDVVVAGVGWKSEDDINYIFYKKCNETLL